MPAAVQPVTYGGAEAFRKFSVAEYNGMIATGILDDEDKVELLEGRVVLKMPRDPRHNSTIERMIPLVFPICPAGWSLHVQSAITLTESQPEPDFAIVRGSADDYEAHHPYPSEIGGVIEVANTSLQRDTLDKTRSTPRTVSPSTGSSTWSTAGSKCTHSRPGRRPFSAMPPTWSRRPARLCRSPSTGWWSAESPFPP